MTTTIGESFRLVPQNALPQYPVIVASADAALQYWGSADSRLARVELPCFATPVPTSHWTDIGLSFISPISSLLDNEFLPRREDFMYHYSERDVARAAALHLIHPINQALRASPDLAGMIACRSGHTSNRACSRIVFTKAVEAPGSICNDFAVVEFQNRGVIRHYEFRAAEKLITDETPVEYYTRAVDTEVNRSFFQGCSRILIKQAASYAISHDTKYVALFNWDFLILIRFNCLEQGPDFIQEQGVGDFCEITILPHESDSHVMRAALLGFLVEAYQTTLP